MTWMAAEPAARAVFRTPFSNVRLLGAAVSRGRRGWRPLGALLHASAGAAFGSAFARAGGRGPAVGVVAALAENVLAWPLLALAERVHPDRRTGAWPPLSRNARVFAQETAGHALFGLVLGALLPARARAGAGRRGA
jgi:hypothetical protein